MFDPADGWKVDRSLKRLPLQNRDCMEDQDPDQMMQRSSQMQGWLKQRKQTQALPEVAFEAWNFEALFDPAGGWKVHRSLGRLPIHNRDRMTDQEPDQMIRNSSQGQAWLCQVQDHN